MKRKSKICSSDYEESADEDVDNEEENLVEVEKERSEESAVVHDGKKDNEGCCSLFGIMDKIPNMGNKDEVVVKKINGVKYSASIGV